MKKSLLLTSIILATIISSHAQTNWVIDKSHTNITFMIKHMAISEVTGSFKEFDIKISSNTEDFSGATITFTAKTSSISTDNEMRDKHLRSDDFFNSEKFPEIQFTGQLVKKGKRYTAVGKLTIREVTKDIAFDVIYLGTLKTTQFTKAAFKLNGSINRFDYNLKWDKTIETGGLVAGKDVSITANVELNLVK